MSRTAAEILEEARQLPPGEPEPGYDEWFRAGVEEALADTSPGIPHETVMTELHDLIGKARERKSKGNTQS